LLLVSIIGTSCEVHLAHAALAQQLE